MATALAAACVLALGVVAEAHPFDYLPQESFLSRKEQVRQEMATAQNKRTSLTPSPDVFVERQQAADVKASHVKNGFLARLGDGARAASMDADRRLDSSECTSFSSSYWYCESTACTELAAEMLRSGSYDGHSYIGALSYCYYYNTVYFHCSCDSVCASEECEDAYVAMSAATSGDSLEQLTAHKDYQCCVADFEASYSYSYSYSLSYKYCATGCSSEYAAMAFYYQSSYDDGYSTLAEVEADVTVACCQHGPEYDGAEWPWCDYPECLAAITEYGYVNTDMSKSEFAAQVDFQCECDDESLRSLCCNDDCAAAVANVSKYDGFFSLPTELEFACACEVDTSYSNGFFSYSVNDYAICGSASCQDAALKQLTAAASAFSFSFDVFGLVAMYVNETCDGVEALEEFPIGYECTPTMAPTTMPPSPAPTALYSICGPVLMEPNSFASYVEQVLCSGDGAREYAASAELCTFMQELENTEFPADLCSFKRNPFVVV